MRPSVCLPPLTDIGFHWNDEELIKSLERMVDGATLPGNVITDINPYNVLPWNLPYKIWYLFSSEESRASIDGFWKARGEACRIHTNSPTTVWKTTLEFYVGQAPHESKTDWKMLEYRLTLRGNFENSKAQDSRSLCIVFGNRGQIPNNEIHHNQGENENMLPAVANRYQPSEWPVHPIENQHEIHYFSNGDFLELDDLNNPESQPSSSGNSSCLTITSDEYFDSLALLQELDAENNEAFHQKRTDSRFSVNSSLQPTQLVFRPSSSGSIPGSHGSKQPREKTMNLHPSASGLAVKQHVLNGKDCPRKAEMKKVSEGPSSSSKNVMKSTSGLQAAVEGGSKNKTAAGRKKKPRSKFCCFFPF